tara:strand:- start:514 stop:780 length:267 start_codon:yes stop_codon:yes gene_type:complete
MKIEPLMTILTADRDEWVYADVEITPKGRGAILRPGITERGEHRFINMHNMTEKEIRKEIRHRMYVSGWYGDFAKIDIHSIYLKDGKD